jgi:benzodiazapine receptor
MKTQTQYQNYRRPTWAPPSWLFAPVWTFLYILIAISFGDALHLYTQHAISFFILLPFLLNLVFNAAYSPIQFRLRNFSLALADILLLDATLIWALVVIYPTAPWISFMNLPYLVWVCFATVLQTAVTILNK